jgi:hypothetical protein
MFDSLLRIGSLTSMGQCCLGGMEWNGVGWVGGWVGDDCVGGGMVRQWTVLTSGTIIHHGQSR